jgi:hypothetical protein
MDNEQDLIKLRKNILEIIDADKKTPARPRKLNNWWLSIGLAALVVVAVVQVVQSATILTAVAGSSSRPATSSSAPAAVPAPSSIQNLPNMVGGC